MKVQKDGLAPQSGFVWDEASGYYYDASSGFYYDGNTGYFCLFFYSPLRQILLQNARFLLKIHMDICRISLLCLIWSIGSEAFGR